MYTAVCEHVCVCVNMSVCILNSVLTQLPLRLVWAGNEGHNQKHTMKTKHIQFLPIPPFKVTVETASSLRPYPVRFVMVPNVIGCLICARGVTTIKLGRGESRGLPGLLLVKLL